MVCYGMARRIEKDPYPKVQRTLESATYWKAETIQLQSPAPYRDILARIIANTKNKKLHPHFRT